MSLSVLCTGCWWDNPHLGPIDSQGFYGFQIDQVYERPSAKIRIDILHACVGAGSPPGCEVIPVYDFTPTEIKLLVQALDSLSDADLLKSGLKFINPELDPNYLTDKPTYTNGGLDIPVPDTYIPNRPSNLNIRDELLTALGFPPPATPGASSPALTPAAALVTTPALRETTAVPLESHDIVMTSEKSPSDYQPIDSPTGQQALNSENAMVLNKDPKKLPTLLDQIRPHGQITIIQTYNH